AKGTGHVLPPDAMQDTQRGIAQVGQQFGGFPPGGDEEIAAAGRPKMAQHIARAKAVTVRLDRRAATGVAAPACEPLPVGPERGAIQMQSQRRGRTIVHPGEVARGMGCVETIPPSIRYHANSGTSRAGDVSSRAASPANMAAIRSAARPSPKGLCACAM